MQGQRSTVGSLPETITFEHGTASSNAGLEPPLYWSNMRNSAHSRLPDYVIPPNDPNIAYLNSTNHDGQNLSGWNLGESSSSGPQNLVSHDHDRKTEHGCSSLANVSAGPSSSLGGQRYEPHNGQSLNNVNNNQIANGLLFLPSSSSVAITQDLNINPGFVEQGVDDGQGTGSPNMCKFIGNENGRMVSSSYSSEPFAMPSGSGGFIVEESDDRPGCSSDGRRLSCKRKALEGHVGPSSVSGSSSYVHHAESSAWHAVPARLNACSSLSISTPPEYHQGVMPPEQVNPRLGLGVGGAPSETPLALNMAVHGESSRRNFRMRINPSHQEDFISSNLFPPRSGVGHSNFSLPHPSSRFLPVNNSLELNSAQVADNPIPQRQSSATQVPVIRWNSQSSRWDGASSSRSGSSSGPVVNMERDSSQNVEYNLASMPRNISEHPMFISGSELRNPVQDPTNWGLTGGNIGIAGNVASTSRTGSSSSVHPSSTPNLVPPRRNHAQYPRRLSEFVRRSMIASAASESGGHSSNSSTRRPGSSSSAPEVALPSGASSQGHHVSRSRSAMLLERQLDGAFGVPYSVRALAAAGEGRSRLVSEIRNMLDTMRRGEGLRLEDVMILDQSVFFGMADLHDRHRDMRLDVDNMSYEELLALEDRIGYVNTGLSDDTIINRLKQRKYIPVAMGDQEVEPCCICQEEFNDGEDLGVLECGHDFHTQCIKQWLTHKNLCPICKTTALVT